MSCYTPEGAANRTRETCQHYEKDIHKWDYGRILFIVYLANMGGPIIYKRT